MKKGRNSLVMLLSIILFIGLILLNVIALRADGIVNLSIAANQAIIKNVPIMILFVDSDCDDCEIINKEVIMPMKISGDYTNKVIIQEVDIEADNIIGFNNKFISMEDFMKNYNIELTPTASFVDARGVKLVTPISGLSNLEYYGSLVDDAIENSLIQLRE